MTSALGSQIGQFIERKRAEQATELSRKRLAFLAEASRVLSASLELDVTLQQIAELAVPTLADWCGVSIVEPDGTLKQVAIAHVDREKVKWARQLAERYPPDPDSPHGVYAVVRSQQSIFMPVIPEQLLVESAVDEEHLRIILELQARSYIAAPLMVRDRAFGVIAFLTTAESARIYDEEDLAFAEELARRAGVAVENAQLFRRAVENEEQQRFLADVGTALASSLDYHGTLQRVPIWLFPPSPTGASSTFSRTTRFSGSRSPLAGRRASALSKSSAARILRRSIRRSRRRGRSGSESRSCTTTSTRIR